jgi:hypothetical protein
MEVRERYLFKKKKKLKHRFVHKELNNNYWQNAAFLFYVLFLIVHMDVLFVYITLKTVFIPIGYTFFFFKVSFGSLRKACFATYTHTKSTRANFIK